MTGYWYLFAQSGMNSTCRNHMRTVMYQWKNHTTASGRTYSYRRRVEEDNRFDLERNDTTLK